MHSHARVLGHPLHQMLVPIPFGLLFSGAVLDIVHRFTEAAWIPTVSFWNLTIGICGALFAAIFGVVDLLAIPDGTRAKRIGGLHAIGNIIVLGLFTFAVFTRHDTLFAPASSLALGLEIGALALAGVTGWLGGELVDRLGVGVDDGANLDAPSSLTHTLDAPPAPRFSSP